MFPAAGRRRERGTGRRRPLRPEACVCHEDLFAPRSTPAGCGGQLPGGMPPARLRHPHLLLLLLLACQPQAPAAQAMDFLFQKWKLYGDQCLRNLSLLPPPTEPSTSTPAGLTPLPTPRPTSPAPGTCPGTTKHRLVFKRCGPDGQWVRGPRGQPWRNASQCQVDDEELGVQREVAEMYSSFQVMYTAGYSLSLGALLLALAILLGLSKLHCTRNYIHANLLASFVLRASSVLALDALLKTRYSQRLGDDLSVSIWLSAEAVAGCRVAAVFMQYGVVANYCWLLVEGVYLHSLLRQATIPERSCFPLYLAIGWGAPMLFVIPWAVVKCLFENIQCWTSNDNMGFWWILRFPVFLAILVRGPATRWQRREGSEAAAVGRPAPSFLAGLQQPEETDSTLPEWRGREAWHSARTLAGTHPWPGTRSPRAPGARAGLAADPPRRGTGWGRALLCPHVQVNFSIFIRVLHVLAAKLRAHQMRCTDYKFRLARSTLTLIPLLGVHEVVFAFVTDEHAQGALRSAKLFFDLFLSSFQGLLVAVLYCFLNKEVQAELLRRWHRWREGKALQKAHRVGSHSARPPSGPPSEKLLLSTGGSSNGTSQEPSAETRLASGLPGVVENPF
ncbi:glucagon receptor isoform X2 [Phacochoerus africanus]|uniref:glucagon receptor isoform X2 n=1 Tax=Phacochoerus africanus TaxID=41426 RepID=UPI001FDA6125|nr:glucagon receptor isoform X2 [Phacochoerus africanus]